MKAPPDTIYAPAFPPRMRWVNTAGLRMDKQKGRPVLIEFWDFCRINSLRTLPYLKEWHRRYNEAGLRVIGVHAGGFPPSQDEDAVAEAVERLGIEYPVVIDSKLEIWDLYGNEGWPARYLWTGNSTLLSLHYGEGGYEETEREIQELLDVADLAPMTPVRVEDEPGLPLPAQTEDQPGLFSGPYEAGGVWAVLEGVGEVRVNGQAIEVPHSGCYPLIEHSEHTMGVLDWKVSEGLTCHATCFTPGVSREART